MPSNALHSFGDATAAQQRFLALFLRSEREIFRYVAVLVPNVIEAEEIVQQTALALWEKFDSYDPARPFTPWACRFALNQARQWMERRQKWQILLADGLAEELARRRVAKLPGEQRTVVEGYYYRRLGIEALAKESGRTVEATYKKLQRIRSALRQCLENAVKLV